MKTMFISAVLAVAMAAPLQAQELGANLTPSTGWFFTPYAGYMVFGDLAEAENGVEFSNEDGGFYGAQLGYSFSDRFSAYGNFGYSKSAFTLEDPTGPVTQVSGDIGVWLYDAGVQFRPVRVTGWNMSPFLQAGVGAIRYTQEYDDFESDARTDVQFNVGAGADLAFAPGWAFRVMVKDYVTSLTWDDAGTIGEDINDGDWAHNFAFTAGLNIGF